MVIFDPYSDRLARDIRNSLSSALVNELTANIDGNLSVEADDWLSKAPAPIYQAYIRKRLSIYRRAISEIQAGQVKDAARSLARKAEMHLSKAYFPRIRNADFIEFILTTKPTSNIAARQYLADLI
jgi:hypothetical protein